MTDEKMIKEMSNIIHHTEFVDISGYEEEKIAEELLKHYQPKLPENAVVLTKEEYSDYLILQRNHEFIREKAKQLQEDNERLYKNIGKFKDIVRKETAREVLDKVYDWGQGFFIEHSFMEEDEFNGILDEVKKLFLNVVEVEE